MYPRIPWELVADRLEFAEHTLGTADLEHGISNCGKRTTVGTPTTVYWYSSFIKNLRTKMRGVLKNR
jgi:hypothetical protein